MSITDMSDAHLDAYIEYTKKIVRQGANKLVELLEEQYRRKCDAGITEEDRD